MPIAKQKVAQAYIQGMIEVIDKLQEANTKAQGYKSLFEAKGINISDTNLTSVQVSAVNTFITSLDKLATGTVVTTIKAKDHPSHGTGALE